MKSPGSGNSAPKASITPTPTAVSKLKWRLEGRQDRPLTVEEAFWLGTAGGGAFFGKTGSFDDAFEFDALVLDDSPLAAPFPLSLKERLERVMYLFDDSLIK